MKRSNQGQTTLKRRRRTADKMGEYDRLSPELRQWLSSAMLPWRPRSVQRAFAKAYDRTGDAADALSELDQMQRRMITTDARKIWGAENPDARLGIV